MKKVRYPYLNNPFGFVLPKQKEVTHPIVTCWDELTDADKDILHKIKSVVFEKIGQEVPIYLFGSRVKGTWDENSDYDISVGFIPSKEISTAIRNFNFGIKVDFSFVNHSMGGFGHHVKI